MATLPIVNTEDKRKGLIAALVVLLGLFIYLLLTTFEIADPPPKPPVLTFAEPLEILEIEKFTIEGGAGSGKPSDDPIKEPEPQVENIITSNTPNNTQSNSGQGSTTTTTQSDAEPSTSQQSNDPFNPGGSGNGDGNGEGTGIGSDSGNGTEGTGGPGGGSGRIRLNNVSMDNLQYNSDEKIYLKLMIDAKGNVVQATNLPSLTTTTDAVLISKVIAAVKKQVKYNEQKGAPLASVSYTVVINAQ